MENFYLSVTDIYLFPVFLIFGILILFKFKSFLKLTSNEIIFIYSYHSLFTIIYFIFSINNFNDSVYYFLNTEKEIYNFSFGTFFIQSTINLFVNNLKISLFNLFYFFNIFSSFALALIYSSFKSLKLVKPFEKIIIIIICFLPSIYFWSSSVGKETVTFLAIGFLLFAHTKKSINYFFIIIAFILMLLVRPFMAGFMIITYPIIYLFRPNKYFLLLLPVIIAFTISFLIFLKNYMNRLSYDFFYNFNSLFSFIEKRKSDTVHSNFTDMTNEGFFLHFFSYLYRPLPFEVFNPLYLYLGLENLVLSIITIYLAKSINFSNMYNDNKLPLFLFSIISGFFFVIATYNLGIAIRQKWFFLIPFFFTILSCRKK